MRLDRIVDECYFEWLCDRVARNKLNKGTSFSRLLLYLHKTDFRWIIPKDENRAEDGYDLRYRFAYDFAGIEKADEYLEGPCSVLEMMVALAVRCEEDIMDDAHKGDRTSEWFWIMVKSLGLGSMMDHKFDDEYVEEVIETFLDREYSPDGRGGLFTIKDCEEDLRDVEIWMQLCWYLDSRWLRY